MPASVLRAGKRLELQLQLRAMRPEQDRVPPYVYGRGPDYVIEGGLVFQELTRFYLASWGDWTRRAPPRLLVAIDRAEQEPGEEGRRIVLLASVLPDTANLGYQELHDLIVTRVDGRELRNLADVRQAFQQRSSGFHVIDFLAGQAAARIVIDAAEAAAAGERLRRAYGVEKLDSGAP
jgi:hypothetical protein